MINKPLLKTVVLMLSMAVSFNPYNVMSQWVSQTSPTSGELSKVTFINSTTGFISGSFNSMYKTTNGGVTWSQISNCAAKDICFFDANNGYAAGVAGMGTMKRTTNGGSSWTTLTSPTSSSAWGVFATSSTTVYFITTDNIVYKSTNSGNSFTPVTLNGAGDPTDIFFVDASTGFVVDESGKIWKTTNAGASWTNIYTISGCILRSVFFVNPNIGFVCGSVGKILKTIDGGANWTTLSTGTSSAYLASICFSDANNGLCVGYNGVILSTSDGGSSWTNETTSTTENLFSVCYITNNSAIVVGNNGIILKNSGLNSVNELGEKSFLGIYPNPFSLQTTIEIEVPLNDATLTIENCFGQTVKQIKNISGQSVILQRDNLQSGLYFIRLIQDNKIIETKKIIITG